MKTKITTILTTICASGLLFSAAAQTTTNTPDDNNASVSPDQSASSSTGGNTGDATAPDAGASGQDEVTPDQTPDQAPDQSGAMTGDQTAPTDQTGTAPADQTGTAPATNQPVTSTVIIPKATAPQTAPQAVPSAFTPPEQVMGTNSNDINMNFTGAPLEEVLNYLSDAAGFIIDARARISGNVTIIGKHMTQDEAVDLLNTELNRNGYAAIRSDRTLTIMDKNDAKLLNIPVKTGNIYTNIPNDDVMATWIIPIRFVDASQLVSELQSFVSAQATIVSDPAGNSIVVTDTQANIRHLTQIIQAVDNSAETETEIRVFPLKFANPTDVANELATVFPNSTSGAQSPIQFGGGRFGGRFGGGGGGNTSQQRIQKATQITAVPDPRIQAVIVTAPKDLMDQIADVVTELDVDSDRSQNVYTYTLKNADPYATAQFLQNTFGGSTSRAGTSSSQGDALATRQQNNQMSSGTTPTSGIGGTSSGGGGQRIP